MDVASNHSDTMAQLVHAADNLLQTTQQMAATHALQVRRVAAAMSTQLSHVHSELSWNDKHVASHH